MPPSAAPAPVAPALSTTDPVTTVDPRTTTIDSGSEINFDQAPGLMPDQVITGELTALAKQTYRLPLAANQYVRLQITPQDVSLKAAIVDAAGRVVVESAGKDFRQQAQLQLSVLTPIAADYYLIITAAAMESGSYQLSSLVWRTATARDTSDLAIERLSLQAEKLQLQATPESLRQAQEILLKVLAYWQQAGERELEATALSNLGMVSLSLNDTAKGLTYLDNALQLWEKVNNPTSQLLLANSLGNAYLGLKDYERGLSYYQRALTVALASKAINWQAVALNAIGRVYNELGQYQKALDFYAQALPLRQSSKDRRGEAITLSSLGNVYVALQQYQEALTQHQRALTIFQEIMDRSNEAATYNNIAKTYLLQKKYPQTIENFERSLTLKEQLGDRRTVAGLYGSIGYIYLLMVDTADAPVDALRPKVLENLEKSLAVWQELKETNEQAAALVLLSKAYERFGDSGKALDYSNQALTLRAPTSTRNKVVLPPPTISNKATATTPSNTAITAPNSVNNSDNASNTNNTNNPTERSASKANANAPAAKSSPVTPSTKAPEDLPPQNRNGRYQVQVGALSTKNEAYGLCRQLQTVGVIGVVVPTRIRGRAVYRVRINGFETRQAAERAANQIQQQGIIRDYFITNH
jgi:tetratricopeptide (TPR) repeat protein